MFVPVFDYASLYDTMVIRPAVYAAAREIAVKISKEPRYKAVSRATGVPVSLIGVLHQMESDRRFDVSYFNGIDNLRTRTRIAEPYGQPDTGKPPFTWEQTAIAAIKYDGLDGGSMTPGDLCAKAIVFNGLGYERKGINSPYGFAGTNLYTKGKYVSDGRYSASAVSGQIGACVIIKAFEDIENEKLAEITPIVANVPYVQQREPHRPEGIDPVRYPALVPVVAGLPAKIYVAPRNTDRASVWFTFGEFTKNGQRQIPNKQIENNIRNLAGRLDQIRDYYGKPVIIVSGYRDPATNLAVGGVIQSSHVGFQDWMAADIRVVGVKPHRVFLDFTESWEGGIGDGESFTHFDTRTVPPGRRWGYQVDGSPTGWLFQPELDMVAARRWFVD
jgi:lysozyme family protein